MPRARLSPSREERAPLAGGTVTPTSVWHRVRETGEAPGLTRPAHAGPPAQPPPPRLPLPCRPWTHHISLTQPARHADPPVQPHHPGDTVPTSPAWHSGGTAAHLPAPRPRVQGTRNPEELPTPATSSLWPQLCTHQAQPGGAPSLLSAWQHAHRLLTSAQGCLSTRHDSLTGACPPPAPHPHPPQSLGLSGAAAVLPASLQLLAPRAAPSRCEQVSDVGCRVSGRCAIPEAKLVAGHVPEI